MLGSATVTYSSPKHAEKAATELDGKSFRGFILVAQPHFGSMLGCSIELSLSSNATELGTKGALEKYFIF